MELIDNYNIDKINNILDNMINLLKENEQAFNKGALLDNKECGMLVNLDKILGIIISYKNKKEPIIKNEKNEIINGIGKIACIYNGNPYITINLICEGLRTNNDLSIYIKEEMIATNQIIFKCLNEAIKKENANFEYQIIINKKENKFFDEQEKYDSLLYIGNNQEYLTLELKTKIPIIYENYGSVHIYVDDKEFKNILIKIDKYAYLNDIEVSYYMDKDINKSIEEINSLGKQETVAIFTKNEEKINSFMKNIKSSKIFVNNNPFIDYQFNIDENKLVLIKEIYI